MVGPCREPSAAAGDGSRQGNAREGERNMKQSTRNVVGFAVLAVLLAVLFYWNINTGSVHLSLERIFTLLRWGNDGSMEGNILWKIRLSRLLGAALLGGALSIAGFLLQTFFKNPIAGPFVLGISSGSRLFVGFFLLAATPIVTGNFSPYVIFLAAFAGALAAMALVLAVSSRVQNLAMLLVIGMMIGYICDAGTDFMITFAESNQLQNFTVWTMGSFSGLTWATLGASALITFPTVLLVFLLSKPLGAYLLGESYAKSMGVNIKGFRVALILLSSILSACVTAFAGPISFVGIAVPHLMKSLFGTAKPVLMIPACFLGGAAFCLFSDLIARTAFAPTEVSISSVTAVLGAPVVIYIMIRRRREMG